MTIPLPPNGEQAKSGEPALKVGAVVSAVTAISGLLVAFGVGIDEKQAAAIIAAVIALGTAAPLVSAWFTRMRVYSPATVAKLFGRDRT